MVRRHFSDLPKDGDGARGVPAGENLLAHVDERRDLGFGLLRLALDRKLRQQLIEDSRELALRPGGSQIGDELALEQGIDGGDGLDAKLGGDGLVRVDIDLDQRHALRRIIGGDLFEDRGQLLAGPAPFGPEIEDDQPGHRRLDDVAPECLQRVLLGRAHTQRRHVSFSRVRSAPMWDGDRPCQPRSSVAEFGLAGARTPC